MCLWTCLRYVRDYPILLVVPLGFILWWRYKRGWIWWPKLYCRDVQLYCRRSDDLANDVCKDMKASLGKHGYNLQNVNSNNINYAKPTIVVCFKTSRPLADVAEATRDLSLNNKMVLVIFHLTTQDPLTDGCSELVKGYPDYASLGLLIDLGFRNNQGRYCLNGNSYNLKLIANFFSK